MIGKPYSGKPNVRFDEGELEIERVATTPALYSTVTHKFGSPLQENELFTAFLRFFSPRQSPFSSKDMVDEVHLFVIDK
jgi:hypothetical protein